MTRDDLINIGIGICILWILYMVINYNLSNQEKFVSLSQGSLNDCLTSCGHNDKCLSAVFTRNTNDCTVSQKFGELGGQSTYTKKNQNGDVFIDSDYNEYNVLESANAQIIDWSTDNTNIVVGTPTFENSFQDFTLENIDENIVYSINEDYELENTNELKPKRNIINNKRLYKYTIDDDFLEI
jgi:hypothetical protein